jgi:hypothetical protein
MTLKRRTEAASGLLENRLKSEFKTFLAAIWHELGLPSPTRAQYAIADYLQHGPKRLQVQAFRGIGKSYVTAAYVLWELYRDKDKKIMCISASKERADNNSIFIQKLILSIPWLSHMRPNSDEFRWSRISFDIGGCKPTQAPSVKSVGITGNMTGSRADIMLFDDVEVPGNSATDMLREKLLQLVSEAEAILMPKPTSRILFLGTPQTTFTVYRKLAERGYRPFVWPSRYPEKLELYEGLLAPQIEEDMANGAKPGDPTDTRFSDLELMEREAAMGRSNFQLQFQLNTTLSDAEKFPLRFADFIVTPLGNECAERYTWSSDPRYVLKDLPAVGLPGDRWYSPMFIDAACCDYSETIVSLDPSGRGLDETVAVVLSQANGYIFVRDMVAFRDGYSDETLRAVVSLAKRYKAGTMLVESNFGDGMVCELLKKHLHQQQANMHVEEVRATVRKEERIIDTLEPVLNQHRLIIDPKIIEWDYRSNPDVAPEKRLEYMLGYQLSRMCREKGAVKHDDRIDALAQGIQWFTDALALSAAKQQAQRRNDEWEAMQEMFINEPQRAADALALGLGFLELKQRPPKGGVYDWVQAG